MQIVFEMNTCSQIQWVHFKTREHDEFIWIFFNIWNLFRFFFYTDFVLLELIEYWIVANWSERLQHRMSNNVLEYRREWKNGSWFHVQNVVASAFAMKLFHYHNVCWQQKWFSFSFSAIDECIGKFFHFVERHGFGISGNHISKSHQ